MLCSPLPGLQLFQSKGSTSVCRLPVPEPASVLSLGETSIGTKVFGIYHGDTGVNRNSRTPERLLDKFEIIGNRDAIFWPRAKH